MKDRIDLQHLHNSLLKAASYDSDIAWEAISKAWLGLDQSVPLAMQIVYLRKAALGHILDIYTKRRNTAFVAFSSLDSYYIDDEGTHTISSQDILVNDNPWVQSEDEIINEYLEHCPDNIKKPVRVLLEAVFAGYFHNGMDAERVRKLFQLKKITGNVSNLARISLAFITNRR